MGTIRKRLRRAEDLLAIHELLVRYGRCIGASRYDDLAELFTVDGTLDLGPMGIAVGRENIASMMKGMLTSREGIPFQLLSSPLIELHGESATTQIVWSTFSRGEDGSPIVMGMGQHRDQLVKVEGQWKIKRRNGYMEIPAVNPPLD